MGMRFIFPVGARVKPLIRELSMGMRFYLPMGVSVALIVRVEARIDVGVLKTDVVVGEGSTELVVLFGAFFDVLT